jgi:hypothetical protein
MDAFSLPDLVTSATLQELLNVGRAQLSRLRSGDTNFPEPDPGMSTPRRPVWRRSPILRWLVATGRDSADVLPAFDASPIGDVEQRWTFERLDFVPVSLAGSPGEVAAMRYRPLSTRDPRVLTICVPVGNPATGGLLARLSTPLLNLHVIEALGYGSRGLRGAVAVIAPADDAWGATVSGAEIPDGVCGAVSLERLPAAVLAGLVGHPLPRWRSGTVSKIAAAQWRPKPSAAPRPVLAGIPPALTDAHRLRLDCRIVLDEIHSGLRSAPTEIPSELAHLGNTPWDSKVDHLFTYSSTEHDDGWVDPIIAPLTSREEQSPILPPQPQGTDRFHALEWLMTEVGLPDQMLRYPIDYFGYPDSLGIAAVDLDALPDELRCPRRRPALVSLVEQDNWLQTALMDAAVADLGPASAEGEFRCWTLDSAPHTHPALLCDTRLYFHVPRSMRPITALDTIHVIAHRSEHGRVYTGFVIDRHGSLSPLPLLSTSTEEVAGVLAAVALGIVAPVALGRTPKLQFAPEPLLQMTEGLTTTRHLEMNCSMLQAITGPRPDAADEDEFIRIVTEQWR